jgi:pimeloyl-ACP methyl ester carboxylesterase
MSRRILPALGDLAKKGNLMRRFQMLAVILVLGWAPSVWGLDWSVYGSDPSKLSPPLEFHQLDITTTDSLRIAAWFLPALDSLGAVASERRPGVLVLTGEGETLPDRLPLLAALVHRGFAVLAVEHRGHGASQAFASTPGVLVYPEYRVDATSALDILWRRPEVDTTRVAVYGESQGAVLAMALAGRRPEVRAVVAVGLLRDWKSYYSTVKKLHPEKEVYLPKTWERRDDPDKVVNRFNGSIFFVAGEMDTDTPAWMSRELYRKYPRPKEYWVVDNAGHLGEHSPERVLGEAYYDRVAGFLTRELSKKPHRGWPYR